MMAFITPDNPRLFYAVIWCAIHGQTKSYCRSKL